VSEDVYPTTRAGQPVFEGLRAVYLSDGRCVLVDADDPNRDEVIQRACEEEWHE
jgi:hypothetical protein